MTASDKWVAVREISPREAAEAAHITMVEPPLNPKLVEPKDVALLRRRSASPSVMRQVAREHLSNVLHIAKEIAEGKITGDVTVTCPECSNTFTASVPKPSDQIAGIRELSRIGIPASQELSIVSDDVKDRLTTMLALIASRQTWDSASLALEIEGIWA